MTLRLAEVSGETRLPWIILIIAGLFETGWAVGLKFTDGFTRPWPSVWTAACLVISMALLGWSLRSLPLGAAYAVWTGIGAVGTVVAGILLFREPATVARLVCIGLIVAGIVGLKVFSPPAPQLSAARADPQAHVSQPE